jgi:hypothetical protein
MTDENTTNVIKVSTNPLKPNLAVHLMKTKPDDNDNYLTMCNQKFSVLGLDLTDNPITCKLCKRLNRGEVK